ncbi:MAG: DUF370 domain-containing protein [Clostridiales bacterium]|nr:DUF370 domain-containing protein [Clostridiales bacterium]
MILHLGDDVAVRTRDVIAIIDLTQTQGAVTGEMLKEIQRQNRVLVRKGITAKSAVICAGARRPGGAMENPRVYLSPISTTTLAQRANAPLCPEPQEAVSARGGSDDGKPDDGGPDDGRPGDGGPGDGGPGDGGPGAAQM